MSYKKPEEIEKLIKKWFNKPFTIDADGNYSTDGNVTITFNNWNESELPIKFKYIGGNFDIHKSMISTMKGFPEEIGGDLDIHGRNITYLENVKKIGGTYNVSYCRYYLINYGRDSGLPEEIGGDFICGNNYIPIEIGQLKYFKKEVEKLTKLKGDFICLPHTTKILSDVDMIKKIQNIKKKIAKGDMSLEIKEENLFPSYEEFLNERLNNDLNEEKISSNPLTDMALGDNPKVLAQVVKAFADHIKAVKKNWKTTDYKFKYDSYIQLAEDEKMAILSSLAEGLACGEIDDSTIGKLIINIPGAMNPRNRAEWALHNIKQ